MVPPFPTVNNSPAVKKRDQVAVSFRGGKCIVRRSREHGTSSAKATHAHSEITPPSTHTEKITSIGKGPAISLGGKKKWKNR